MNFFECKSTPENLANEKDVKPNTVRDTKDWDYLKWKRFINSTHIRVRNTEDHNDFIERRIRNKTVYNRQAIISWFDESDARNTAKDIFYEIFECAFIEHLTDLQIKELEEVKEHFTNKKELRLK